MLFKGEDATTADVRDRNDGFAFQHGVLFNHLTIFSNGSFGLRVRPKATRPDEAMIRSKVEQPLQRVQLDWVADRHPHQRSGGQHHRIASARALAVEPKVLLLEEPVDALDAKVCKELRRWLRRLHDEVHVTSVFVTQDQDEAMEVADRVVLMQARGRSARSASAGPGRPRAPAAMARHALRGGCALSEPARLTSITAPRTYTRRVGMLGSSLEDLCLGAASRGARVDFQQVVFWRFCTASARAGVSHLKGN